MKATAKNKTTKKIKEGKKLNGFIKSLLVLISVSALSVLIFLGTYYFFIDNVQNKYENQMKEILASINTENKKTSSLINGNSIKTKASKQTIPKIISFLEKTRDEVDKISPTTDYRVLHEQLLDGLNDNILMYRQILAILENPNSSDINKSVKVFTKAETNTEDKYSQYTLNGSSISLSEYSSNFLKAFEYYSNQLVKIKNDSDIIASKTSDFTDGVDKILASFIQYKTNFSVQLADARNNNNDYKSVIDTADNYKDQCDELEKKLLAISVPDNCSKVQQLFVDIFDNYDTYIDNFIFAVKDEKSKTESSDKKLTKKQLADIYFTAKNNYMSIDEKYTNFIKEYTNLKNSYSQQ